MKRNPILLCLFLLVLAAPSTVTAQAATPEEGQPRIAFITWDDDAETYILNAVDPDGSNFTPLVIGRIVWAPAWSPDGMTLAFLGKVSTGSRTYIYLIDSDGLNLRVVPTPPPLSTKPEFVAWSPDGTQLIYAADSSGSIRFIKLNLDGSGNEWLRFPGLTERFVEAWLAWSPDGSQIAVHAGSDNIFGQIYIADADSQNALPFAAVSDRGNNFSHLEWSPDGQKIALFVHPTLANNTLEGIAVANTDGTGLRMVVTPPPNYISSVTWSPDSRQLVFVANEPNVNTMPRGALYIVDADGSNQRALTLDVSVMGSGTSWGIIPEGVVLQSAPVALDTAIR